MRAYKLAPILALLIILSVNCSFQQFVHNSIPIQDQITTQLENISTIADEAVKLKIFTPLDRQQFAAQVMLPAINANRTYAQCLLTGNCANLSSQIAAMAHAFQVGIDLFVSRMALTPTTTKLSLALNSGIIFVNNLQVKK